MASCLNGRYVKMFKFCFEKICKCIELHKNVQKKELKNIRKRKCQLFLEKACNVLEIVR